MFSEMLQQEEAVPYIVTVRHVSAQTASLDGLHFGLYQAAHAENWGYLMVTTNYFRILIKISL